jgi:hypothetical protein
MDHPFNPMTDLRFRSSLTKVVGCTSVYFSLAEIEITKYLKFYLLMSSQIIEVR